MTPKQIEALKYLIIKAKDGNDLLKKIFFVLLAKSEGLTKEVFLTLEEGPDISRETIIDTSRNLIRSSGGTTHLDELMALMGSELHFSLHFGHYVDGKPNKDGSSMRYTFLLSKQMQAGGEQLFVSLDELNAVELTSSLYEHAAQG